MNTKKTIKVEFKYVYGIAIFCDEVPSHDLLKFSYRCVEAIYILLIHMYPVLSIYLVILLTNQQAALNKRDVMHFSTKVT